MNLSYFAGAAFRAFTTRKSGPTLYDLADPVLRGAGPGDAHLRQFYKTALANPALRPLLSRAGLPQLADPARFKALQDALLAARDQDKPDWAAIGAPLAPLIDEYPQSHPKPPPAGEPASVPGRAEVDRMIRACADHLLRAYRKYRYIPCYAAFNLVGDPDLHGRDFLAALTGLKARTYKNSTLLFNLARVFILGNRHVSAVLNPPWRGIAEPMWEPVQIRHRSAYYDAFYAEALMDYIGTGLASPNETADSNAALKAMVEFCLVTSREEVHGSDGKSYNVVTALAPPPHARLSPFFQKIKSDLGFGLYVPDCDTTACSISAATQFGASDPLLDQPMIDFYAGYQVGPQNNRHGVTVPINDNIDYDGALLTWIENLAGDRPYGNDLDPTLNLDVLEATFRNLARWQVVETPSRLETVRRIVRFQRKLCESGHFANPRSHIYYLPELYSAYVGRCYAAFRALPQAAQQAIDSDGSFEVMRTAVLAYVQDDLIAHEMNPFDAALALLALAKLGAPAATFARPLAVIARDFGEGGRRTPYKAYEWNKMKTPTRILVGGPEVTSAFVLSALAHAREKIDT